MKHNISKSIEKQNLLRRRSKLASESKAKFEEMKKKLKMYKALVSGKITYLSKYFEDEIRKNECVQEPKRTYFWKKMVENVNEIHKEGIVHADLKPSNFVLHECGLKLINIYKEGTSHYCDISYMSPELIKNNQEDSQLDKVDIWSLGIILCQMTFGKLLFEHLENTEDLKLAICDPMRSDWKIDIDSIEDENLRSLIKGCLMYNPADRYSIEQLLKHPYITKEEKAYKTEVYRYKIEQLK